MNVKIFKFYAATAVLIGCIGTPNPPPSRALPEGRKADCQTAKDNLDKIGSDLANDTPEGDKWLDICNNALSTPAARLDVKCLTLAATPKQADDC